MSRLNDWAVYYFNKIKPYIPMLIGQMKKQGLNKEQALEITREVFKLATEEFSKKFT